MSKKIKALVFLCIFGILPLLPVKASDDKISVNAIQEYCHGVTISPAGNERYDIDKEITYTIKGVGNTKPSYFVINGKKVEGTLVDEYTMTCTFTDEMKKYDSIIYGIGEEISDSTYTVDVTILPENGINVSKTGVHTYSSEEETTYTIKSIAEDIRPGYFVINGERVEGKIVDKQTLSYTFPKGTTGVYKLYGAAEDFRDVNKEDWFYTNVTYVDGKNLMTGLKPGTFAPAQPLARAQFMVILHRIEEKPEAMIIPAMQWADVTDEWYINAIYWGFEHKIMEGYSDSDYWGTADNMTREQIAAVMYRYAKNFKKYEVSEDGDCSRFPDAETIQPFAQEAMKWAVSEEIITGKTIDGELLLDPQGSANRAECATIIQRFLEKYEK